MALLEVENLKVYYPVRGGWFRPKRFVRAVDGVSFSIEAGEIVGLVGESGCGKSTLGRALVRLEKPVAGRVLLNGRDLGSLKGQALRRERKHFQMIFQDPYGSLNPRLTVFSATAIRMNFPAVSDRESGLRGRWRRNRRSSSRTSRSRRWMSACRPPSSICLRRSAAKPGRHFSSSRTILPWSSIFRRAFS